MPDYQVTVSKSFAITAKNKDKALERAEEIADKLILAYGKAQDSTFSKYPSWLGDQVNENWEVDEA